MPLLFVPCQPARIDRGGSRGGATRKSQGLLEGHPLSPIEGHPLSPLAGQPLSTLAGQPLSTLGGTFTLHTRVIASAIADFGKCLRCGI